MHTSYRRSTHRARRYRGERTFGGCLVYAGEALLDKHLFVHRVSPGGFDWGPDADDDRACQLAVALLAPTFGLDTAVDDHHLFATNFVKCELTGDSWSVRSQDLKQSGLRTKFAHREYPENTAPSPEEVEIKMIDFDEISYATEIVLARRYTDVLWTKGNQRANLRRLQEIHTGDLDPAEEPATQQWISMNLGLTSGAAKRKLVSEFETMGYDFRDTQTLWAKPILYFPETGAVVPDTGKRYTRRHYGRATDAAHERANDRVPITEWWQSIYDDIGLRMVEVERTIRRARGIAETYASVAADRATTLADPASRPTVYNLQLSLLLALLDEYEGSWASDTYQEYIESAGELLQKPAMMIQLAIQEYDRQTDEPTERVLDEDQQTLSDALEDIVDIPGIDVDTEAALSDEQAQRLHDQVQRELGESE